MSEEEKVEKKTGLYICSGCHIGDVIDVAGLETVATSEFKTPVVKSHKCLCDESGVNLIKEDIANEGVNAVSIVACSPRVMYDTFEFGDGVILDRIDIREKAAWRIVEGEDPEDTNMLAADYIRMGLAKIKEIEFPEPTIDEMDSTILVIGGGITGMSAALDAASAGSKVHLVEMSNTLGGFVRDMKKTLPREAPYNKLADNNIGDVISSVENDDDITIHLNASVESISGAPGMFDATINNGTSATHRVGAVVVATGWKPYEKSKLTHLGSDLPDVVTNVEFEEMAANGKILRPSNGEPPKKVLFIQCAGSRDENHLSYCSSVCCAVSLKQATYLRENDPDAAAIIVYKDMRTPANSELFYKQAQQDPGLFMTKGEVADVTSDGDGLSVTVNETLLGGNVVMKADMVVLAVGMVSSTYDESVTIDKPEDEITDRDILKKGKSSILNLTYRKGAELPHLADDFNYPDSHFICFPYETQRTGIYAAGPARHPADIGTSMGDGAGAALKAIQSINMGALGKAVHPRAGDSSYPDFFLQRCTQCKRCTEECPFGTLDEDEKGTPKPNPTRCRRCGICMGACPERIISFKNYSVAMISSMIKAVDVPDEFSEKSRALVFVCENDAMPAIDMAGFNRVAYNNQVRIIPLRCLGSVNLVWIADALASGWDGILMLGCKHGDDYQCHFVKGSELAETRMSKVQETLDRLMLESERIQVESVAINDYKRIPEIINNFVETLETLEPNPYKGF